MFPYCEFRSTLRSHLEISISLECHVAVYNLFLSDISADPKLNQNVCIFNPN